MPEQRTYTHQQKEDGTVWVVRNDGVRIAHIDTFNPFSEEALAYGRKIADALRGPLTTYVYHIFATYDDTAIGSRHVFDGVIDSPHKINHYDDFKRLKESLKDQVRAPSADRVVIQTISLLDVKEGYAGSAEQRLRSALSSVADTLGALKDDFGDEFRWRMEALLEEIQGAR